MHYLFLPMTNIPAPPSQIYPVVPLGASDLGALVFVEATTSFVSFKPFRVFFSELKLVIVKRYYTYKQSRQKLIIRNASSDDG